MMPTTQTPLTTVIADVMSKDGRWRNARDLIRHTGVDCVDVIGAELVNMRRAHMLMSDNVCGEAVYKWSPRAPKVKKPKPRKNLPPVECTEDSWLLHEMPLAGVRRKPVTDKRRIPPPALTSLEVTAQRQRVLRGLRDIGPISAVQLAITLDLPRGRVVRAIQALYDAGKVGRVGDCKGTKWEAV